MLGSDNVMKNVGLEDDPPTIPSFPPLDFAKLRNDSGRALAKLEDTGIVTCDAQRKADSLPRSATADDVTQELRRAFERIGAAGTVDINDVVPDHWDSSSDPLTLAKGRSRADSNAIRHHKKSAKLHSERADKYEAVADSHGEMASHHASALKKSNLSESDKEFHQAAKKHHQQQEEYFRDIATGHVEESKHHESMIAEYHGRASGNTDTSDKSVVVPSPGNLDLQKAEAWGGKGDTGLKDTGI